MLLIKNNPPSLSDDFINETYKKLLARLNKNYKLYSLVLEDKKIKLSFKTLGVIAGEAKENNISLNYDLLNRQPELFEENLGHELAHSICHFIYKKPMGHGEEWLKIMKALEVKATANHTYNVSDLRLKNQTVYAYQCKCRQHKISEEGHSKFQNSNCICKFCKTEVTYLGILEKQQLQK